MATLSDYVSGTISLANGSVTVTGTGTLFEVTRFREGDTLQIQNLTAVIASVDSDTQLTLAEPWTGIDIVDGPYRARQLGDGSRVSTQAATIIELLGNGVLANLAELGVEEGKVPVGGPAGEYELVDKAALGMQAPNGTVGTEVLTSGGEPSTHLQKTGLLLSSILSFGADVSATNNNGSIVAALSNAPRGDGVFVPAGDFTTTAFSNPSGKKITGPGNLVKSDPNGGTQKLNFDIDYSKYMFGQEYLYAFISYMRKWKSGDVRRPVVFTGDSRVSGVAITDNNYLLNNLFNQRLLDDGIWHITTAVNRGQTGKNTVDWLNNYLAGDLSLNPACLVAMWGLNDGGTYTIDQIETNMRNAAARIRNTGASPNPGKPISELSVVWCTPPSATYSAMKRDERLINDLRPIIMQICREFGFMFLDLFALVRDVRWAAGTAYDDAIGNGTAIHQREELNCIFVDAIYGSAISRSLLSHIGASKVWNVAMSVIGGIGSSTPLASYPKGLSLYLTATGDAGWQAPGGLAVTIMHVDGPGIQFNIGVAGGNMIAARVADHVTKTWLPWTVLV
ncbi:SGNH/GDSL hydrolase family protein [Brucellaceae bacterium VT-16-1752]|nr:SGNH/GDSL hydrolase family protein [Brucellaceae bacterium VT-16-1752]